ncbi:hypothetical protein BFJ63_vAg12016 [Fusarium oxysporum f. sp. narcissi]|uniref:Uncharacterized protein n=1 Tax=Fusarium oxysporum f. sp. narcissi TaxID=451672 RepID=A0A4Q2VIJ5_FUSOX|nr:hypothetical protein BFJ63_vAg12016 [Fusarium oxysporum f. sp. narcissi]
MSIPHQGVENLTHEIKRLYKGRVNNPNSVQLLRPLATPPAGTGSPSIVTAISPSKARPDPKDQAQAQASPGQSSPQPWLGLTSIDSSL